MAEYDPSDFKDPVLDYNFNQIQNTSDLIDQMSEAGGFTATKLAKARDMLSKMFQEAGNEGVVNWISFPAALCATGTRSFFVELVKRRLVDVIVTTCFWIMILLEHTGNISMEFRA